MTRTRHLIGVLAGVCFTMAAAQSDTPLSTDQVRALARDVYRDGYPIVLMDMTARQSTAVPNATAVSGRAPINQFAYFRSYPKADAKDVVRFNFDTLYSFSWVDLSKEPVVLSVGLEPGKEWDSGKLDTTTIDAINTGAKEGLEDMVAGIKSGGTHVNGWNIAVDNMGTYGTSYRQRAIVALAGLGASLPADAIYPAAFVDGDGKPLDGANKYVLHFDKGRTPPAGAFWSLTMYDHQGFQVANPIDRFAIGDRDKLKFNEDGSLDLYIQAESPGKDKEANWLPSPKSGAMGPTLRIYAPKPEALDGAWVPPPFRKVD